MIDRSELSSKGAFVQKLKANLALIKSWIQEVLEALHSIQTRSKTLEVAKLRQESGQFLIEEIREYYAQSEEVVEKASDHFTQEKEPRAFKREPIDQQEAKEHPASNVKSRSSS